MDALGDARQRRCFLYELLDTARGIGGVAVMRKNYGNDVLPEVNYAVLGRRYSVRKYLRVDKL
jgi:hypothetical protein